MNDGFCNGIGASASCSRTSTPSLGASLPVRLRYLTYQRLLFHTAVRVAARSLPSRVCNHNQSGRTEPRVTSNGRLRAYGQARLCAGVRLVLEERSAAPWRNPTQPWRPARPPLARGRASSGTTTRLRLDRLCDVRHGVRDESVALGAAVDVAQRGV